MLSYNPLTVDSNEIKHIKILMTMIGGKIEYSYSEQAEKNGTLSSFDGKEKPTDSFLFMI